MDENVNTSRPDNKLFRKPAQQLSIDEYTARYYDDRNWTGLGAEGGISETDRENLEKHRRLEGEEIVIQNGHLVYASGKPFDKHEVKAQMGAHWAQIRERAEHRFAGTHIIDAIEGMYVALMFGMNCYVEGSSGIGKTAAMYFLCQTLDAPFAELQASSDLSDLHIRGDIIPVKGMVYALDRGPMLMPGAVGLFVDEFPRIPSTTTNVFLESMEYKRATLSVPGREEASHTVLLSRNFFVMGAGNPRGYGGQGERSLALWDRFRIGLNMKQPDSQSRQKMYEAHIASLGRHQLSPTNTEEKRKEQPLPPKFTFRDVQAAMSGITLSEKHRQALCAAAFSITPGDFGERIGWSSCRYFQAIMESPEFKPRKNTLKELQTLVKDNLMEGSNPRGELALIDNARALCMMDQTSHNFTVDRKHMQKALAYAVRSRLKTYPGCEGAVEDIINLANSCFFREA